ncbi:uncharacterized protein N7477_007023 [Penicillium maclennaniae]|uniref:uncharacterized protein n=1 Tax=Penicillium maclennaniae TaxID=1343394 RepID=UPI00253F7D2A|nr:uncharacterized protein N7477_007023 [Penicillium maclennaniae]KAJ5668453.1 hypothetical protein N7477_007023 [Penicillium maclennaniae]
MVDIQTATPISRVWFVTGCSSGFGKLFISSIVARGDRVIATARNISALSEFEDRDDVRLMQLDVTQPQSMLNDAVTAAIATFGQIDVLVNNAGYVLSGVWEQVSHSQTLDIFATNVFGPINLSRAVLPHMRARGVGSIVFMSSLAAWLSVAAGGPYSASKCALEGAAESLQKEVKSFGVEVYIVVLGQFRTGILDSSKRKVADAVHSPPEYTAILDRHQSRLEKTNGKQPGDPVQAVERIFDVVRHEGYMAGKKSMPLRIVLGSDAMDIVRGQCQGMLNDLQEERYLGESTDFPIPGEEVAIERYA